MAQDLHVAAGVLQDSRGHVLIAQRPSGKSMAGYWEFPGGKLLPGETPLQGLSRELKEELGVQVRVARHLIRYAHSYPDVRVHLYVWKVLSWGGQAAGLEDQPLQWLPAEQLLENGLLPADADIVGALCTANNVATMPLEVCFADEVSA